LAPDGGNGGPRGGELLRPSRATAGTRWTIVAGGVVFAYGAGEDSTQTVQDTAWNEPTPGTMGGGLSSGARRRIPGSRHAELVALDGQTGKELWSSGAQIASWNHFSGLTVANGRAYLATFDGYLYCFGVK